MPRLSLNVRECVIIRDPCVTYVANKTKIQVNVKVSPQWKITEVGARKKTDSMSHQTGSDCRSAYVTCIVVNASH